MELNITNCPGFTRLTFVYPYEERRAAYEFTERACNFLIPICGKRVTHQPIPGEFRLVYVAVKDHSPAGMSFEVEIDIVDMAHAALFRLNIEALHARA